MNSGRIVGAYAANHWYSYLIGAVLLASHTLMNTYIPKQTGVIIDLFTDKAALAVIMPAIWGLVGIVLLSFWCQFFWRYCLTTMCRGIDRDLRRHLFSHLQTLAPDFYVKNNTGDLITRSIVDIQAVRAFFGNHIVTLFDMIATIIIALYFMVTTAGWRITLICIAPSPLLMLLLFLLQKHMRLRFRRVQAAASDIGARVQESVTGIRVIKAFAREREENARFEQLSRSKWQAEMSAARLTATLRPAIRLIYAVTFCAYLILGGSLVIRGRLSVGEYTAFNGYLLLILQPMSRCGSIVHAMQRCSVSMRRLDEVYTARPSVDDRHADPTLRPEPRVRLEVRGLSFRYPDREREVLRDVSFTLEPGELLAVMGPTGCGKSTLANLLVRLWECADGCIYLNGREIHSLPLETLRTNLAYVPQDTLLFGDTVGENIRFRDPSLTREDIIAAARTADVHESISAFPDGYDTPVGERGVTLSGGQRQRVAIARAVAARAPLLVLDDSLSAVDNSTEANILRNLRNGDGDRSVLLITHRVSAAMLSDRVLFLREDGSVEGYGPHDRLLKENEAYRRLFESLSDAEGGDRA